MKVMVSRRKRWSTFSISSTGCRNATMYGQGPVLDLPFRVGLSKRCEGSSLRPIAMTVAEPYLRSQCPSQLRQDCWTPRHERRAAHDSRYRRRTANSEIVADGVGYARL